MKTKTGLVIIIVTSTFLACTNPVPADEDPILVPGTPANFKTITIDADSIRLGWDAVPQANEYVVYADNDPEGVFGFEVYRGALTLCEDTGLSQNSDRYYKLIALNAFGSSAPTTALQARTLKTAPDSPEPPLIGVVTAHTIALSWNDPGPGFSTRVVRSLAGENSYDAVYEGGLTSWVDTDLYSNTEYTYKLYTVAAAGPVSTSSSMAGATTSALSIQELRDPSSLKRPNAGDRIFLEDLCVTAIQYSSGTEIRGFFAQADTSEPFSGIYIYTGTTTVTLAVGNKIDVRGEFRVYYGLDELVAPVITITDPGTGYPFTPAVVVDPTNVVIGGPDAPAFQSMLVKVSDVTATSATTGESNAMEFGIDGGLEVSELFYNMDDYAIGDEFTSITGVLYLLNGAMKLVPRSAVDVSEK